MRTNQLFFWKNKLILTIAMLLMISINPGTARALSASVSGTTIPSASQIIDSQSNIWTLSSSSTVLMNGSPAGYSSNVVLLLYYNGIIYQKNNLGGWWSWVGGTWGTASDPRLSVNGVCGTANGVAVSSKPTANLCSSGAGTTVSGSGPWTWSCQGSNGGSNASCSAPFLQSVSVSGTTIPSASQIVDSRSSVWTLSSSSTVLMNGSPAGYTSNVVLILYYNGVIYQKNSAGGWWSWVGGTWTASSDPRASSVNGTCGTANGVAVSSTPTANLCSKGTGTTVSGSGPWTWSCQGSNGGSNASCSAPLALSASANGTTIPSALQIVDSRSNIWTLSSSSAVLMNGSPAGYTSNVVLILYYNGAVYQKNSAGGWWVWVSGTWTASSDPRSGSVNGACGAANGVAVSSTPTANLCSSGAGTAVSGSGPWTWSCLGSNGGTNAQCSAPSTANLSSLFGVNLASAEFGQHYPGTMGVDYTYPTTSELDYYKSKGLTLIRMPFVWERMQPSLNAPLDVAQVGYMTNFLNAADARGLSVILDVHNYGRYGTGTFSDFPSHGNVIGSSAVPVSAFADFWSRVATQFKGHVSLLGYDIMNEPHDMGNSTYWPTAAQAAVNAIRTVDTAHFIFVEGDNWASAASWTTFNNNLNINDPAGHLVYEAHQYFDHNNSGTYTGSYDQEGAYPMIGVDRLQPFSSWLSQHSYKGWVGENGVPNNDSRWLTVLNNFLGALKSNGIWGTYWAGGPWWGTYSLSCEPTSGQDTPQMGILQNYPSR